MTGATRLQKCCSAVKPKARDPTEVQFVPKAQSIPRTAARPKINGGADNPIAVTVIVQVHRVMPGAGMNHHARYRTVVGPDANVDRIVGAVTSLHLERHCGWQIAHAHLRAAARIIVLGIGIVGPQHQVRDAHVHGINALESQVFVRQHVRDRDLGGRRTIANHLDQLIVNACIHFQRAAASALYPDSKSRLVRCRDLVYEQKARCRGDDEVFASRVGELMSYGTRWGVQVNRNFTWSQRCPKVYRRMAGGHIVFVCGQMQAILKRLHDRAHGIPNDRFWATTPCNTITMSTKQIE